MVQDQLELHGQEGHGLEQQDHQGIHHQTIPQFSYLPHGGPLTHPGYHPGYPGPYPFADDANMRPPIGNQMGMVFDPNGYPQNFQPQLGVNPTQISTQSHLQQPQRETSPQDTSKFNNGGRTGANQDIQQFPKYGTDASTNSQVAQSSQQQRFPYNQMYYPYGLMNTFQPYQGSPQPYAVNYKIPYSYPNYPMSGYPNPQSNSSTVGYNEESVLPNEYKHQANVNIFPAMPNGPFYSNMPQEIIQQQQPTQPKTTQPTHLGSQQVNPNTSKNNQTSQFASTSTTTNTPGNTSGQIYSSSTRESFYAVPQSYGQNQPSTYGAYPTHTMQQTNNFSNQRTGQGYQ